ncbi:MAG: hypothetical protein LBD20_01700, partial [Spirochaetaceae bacterium]|nr:hypothetical protein [Spirochaetaceae bacterium]
ITSCGFIDFRPVEVDIFPAAGTVLPEAGDEVSARFNTAVRRLETEAMFKVSGHDGFVEGDFRWEGSALFFKPVRGWLPGTRYVVSLSGTVYAEDGREEQVDFSVPFYAGNTATAPYLHAFSPQNGEVVAPDSGVIRLEFSAAMNRQSVEENFSLDGGLKLEFVWIDDSILEIHTNDKYTAFGTYTWNLAAKSVSLEGVPLAKKESGSFVTNGDVNIPYIEYVYTALRGGNSYGLSSLGLLSEVGLPNDCGIGIVFSRDMDAAAVRSAIAIQPPIAGRLEHITGRIFVYLPEKQPEPECAYMLTISRDAASTTGLKMLQPKTVVFHSAIPYLRVSCLDLSSGSNVLNLPEASMTNGGIVQMRVSPQLNFIVVVHWSEYWTQEAKSAALRGITLEPVFPGGLPPLALISARWTTDNTLELKWQGVDTVSDVEAAAGRQKFYKITINGGEGGLQNCEGSYIKESIFMYIEVIPNV